MKKKIFGITFLLTAIIITAVLSLSITTLSQNKNKKKLYIHNLKAEGVNVKLVKRIKEGINLSILNSFGDVYHVVDEDTIKVMYKQAEAILSSGCTDESCVEQIAEGINADEIIFGTVSSEGGKLNLLVKSMYRTGEKIGILSQVNLTFYETQIDHFAVETGKKLINPQYIMNMNAPLVFDENIHLSTIEVEKVKGLDIAILNFQSKDDIIGQMLDYLKDEVKKGDQSFQQNKFDKAIEEYVSIVERIFTKLSFEKQEKMIEFITGLKKRIGISNAMMFRAKILALDAKVKINGNVDENTAVKMRNEYSKIFTAMTQISHEYKTDLSILEVAIKQRQDALTDAIVAFYEMKGDSAYREYNFDDALIHYEKGKKVSGEFDNFEKKFLLITRLNKKIATTEATGKSYVTSKVQSLIDIAEFYNLKEEKRKALRALENARVILLKTKLAHSEIRMKYEDYSELIGGEMLFKPFIGPSGGWVFYDKGSYSDGWRYLEAASENQSSAIQWNNGDHKFTGANGFEIGTGKLNTQKILAVIGNNNIAVKLCADYRGGGKNDWFLPSSDELGEMRRKLYKAGIGGFNDNIGYWSSTEDSKDNDKAWFHNFYHDFVNLLVKTTSLQVRAIRAF